MAESCTNGTIVIASFTGLHTAYEAVRISSNFRLRWRKPGNEVTIIIVRM